MSTQNHTAYIPTPISDHPKEDGEYFIINSKNRVERFQFGVSVGFWVDGDGDIAADNEFPRDCFWLKPIDLSRMLEDCWKAAVNRTEMGDWTQMEESLPYPDFETYLSHLLNNEKP